MPVILDSPLISCLCLSQNRVPMLRRAVACFQAQSYAARELLIVYRSNDHVTRDYVASLDDARIRGVEAPADGQIQVGGLRNIAVAASRGEYVATWDDDDWSAPERLQLQMETIREHQRPACVLHRCQIYDMATLRAFISTPYMWQMSMVCKRSVLPEYPNQMRGEDRHVVDLLLHSHQLIQLERPDLYIYVYHGANTCGRAHFKRSVFAGASPLDECGVARVQVLLGVLPVAHS